MQLVQCLPRQIRKIERGDLMQNNGANRMDKVVGIINTYDRIVKQGKSDQEAYEYVMKHYNVSYDTLVWLVKTV